MAVNSKGDLFLVDREYDGLLRCAAGATTCAPWSAPGKLRTVKVGPSNFVVTLDDKQQVVRVFDDTGKLVTSLGPMFGTTKLEKISDVAIDSAYALYLLDTDLRRVEVGALRTQGDGRISYLWTCRACDYRFDAIAILDTRLAEPEPLAA